MIGMLFSTERADQSPIGTGRGDADRVEQFSLMKRVLAEEVGDEG